MGNILFARSGPPQADGRAQPEATHALLRGERGRTQVVVVERTGRSPKPDGVDGHRNPLQIEGPNRYRAGDLGFPQSSARFCTFGQLTGMSSLARQRIAIIL